MFGQSRMFLVHSSLSIFTNDFPSISLSIWALLDSPWVDDWHSTCSLANSLSSLLSCKNSRCKWYHSYPPDIPSNSPSACLQRLPSGSRCKAFYLRLATMSKDYSFGRARRKSHSSLSKSSTRSLVPYPPSQLCSGEGKGSQQCYRTTKGTKTCYQTCSC